MYMYTYYTYYTYSFIQGKNRYRVDVFQTNIQVQYMYCNVPLHELLKINFFIGMEIEVALIDA